MVNRATTHFSSQEEEGVFNAAFSLLGNDSLERLYDYAPPFEEMKGLSNWGTLPYPTANKTCPGVWLSVVGARGFWPLHFTEVTPAVDGGGYTYRTPKKTLAPAPALPEVTKQAEASIRQYLPPVPQITWAWCTMGSLACPSLPGFCTGTTGFSPGAGGLNQRSQDRGEWLTCIRSIVN